MTRIALPLLCLLVPWVVYYVVRQTIADHKKSRLPPPNLEAHRIIPTAWREGSWR